MDLFGRTFHAEPAFRFHRANDDVGDPRYRIGRRRLCAEATTQNVRALDFARYGLSGLWRKTSPRSQDTRMPRPGRFPLLSRPARRARHLRRQPPPRQRVARTTRPCCSRPAAFGRVDRRRPGTAPDRNSWKSVEVDDIRTEVRIRKRISRNAGMVSQDVASLLCRNTCPGVARSD